ncbi:hepatitis A virus cellular receptor 2 [Rhinolophus ferrumequinum]|uniref:Hepatitis A virus cellular receptor 2 n=1 Tax=Rhinolophus ferrumequinum TaxID=59479 RepID=A0A7J7RXA9_RHIFE|nr:hepatitis A virus cellular receptor 2 [Rhinolophus ferrumequinum]
MLSHLSIDCVLLWLLLLTRSLEGSFVVEVGQNAYLPCSYSPTSSENLVPVCWGRGSCPLSKCPSLVLSTNGRDVEYQKASRYQLNGNIHRGDVSLTIQNVTSADSGTYCCRIEFPGLLNDKKLDLMLDIKEDTQTPDTLHDKTLTQIPVLDNELQDADATTRLSIYIGAGISAGLTLLLIFGALILKWYSHSKEKLQNSSLITLANRRPSGLANIVDGWHSEGNIYTIEENIYEMEDPSEYYCPVLSGPPS